jgi:hypothetical protein
VLDRLSYRAYYTPLDRDGYPVACESGILPFVDLKATDAEDAARKAFETKRCPIDSVVRIERATA